MWSKRFLLVFSLAFFLAAAPGWGAKSRRLLLVITGNEMETIWQTLRLANFALSQGDTVRIYLTGKGVEMLKMGNAPVDVARKLEAFLKNGGQVYG